MTIISQLLKLVITSIIILNSYQMLLSSDINNQNDPYPIESDFDLDNIFFDEDDYDVFSNEFLDTVGNNHVERSPNPEDIIQFLLGLDILDLLKEPLFLHTNEINQRNLLDQPLFEPDKSDFPKRTVTGVSPFIRKTNRSNFTKNSTKLSSYLALTERGLLNRLENTIKKISNLDPSFNINVAQILFLFENMTVEERQAGFMFHWMRKSRNTTFRIFAPIYFVERNFSLTPREQDAVAEQFGVLDPKEEKAFRKAHFINDKIGFGDTRLEIDQRVFKRPSYSLRCGGQATIPTAFTWGQGFLGSAFPKPSTLPTLNLEPLFDLIKTQTPENEQLATESLTNFFLSGFDRLAANLLDASLGNNRHLGVGAYIRGKVAASSLVNTPFAERLAFTNRISAELFFPSTEKRFYINKINIQEIDNRNFADPNLAAANVIFLKEKLVERLFLRALSTRITPGVIFRWTSQAHYKGDIFGFHLGTDFWIQDKFKFGHINASPQTLQEIDIAKAKPPFATQSKIIGGVVFKHKSPLNYWFISLNGDVTMSNQGIGQDYGVSLNFEASF